jgi:predicted O-linked N-acetylglucosamine transferase (SPINDLY family)
MRSDNSSRADQRLLADAVDSLRSGRLPQAERSFRKLLSLHPEHPAGLNLLGILLIRSGRFAEAEACIRQATLITPDSDATFSNYGLVLKSLDRPHEAFDAFSRALALNPHVAETWNNRGTVLNALGRYDEAILDFDQAMALKPGYAEASCNKGTPLVQRRRYAEALAAFDAALLLDPALAQAWQGRGDVLAALGRHDEAIAAFAKATVLKPDYAEACCNAARSLAQTGRHDDALAAFDVALKLRPDLAAAWKGRGTLLGSLRRYDEAIVAFEAALKADPQIEYVPGDLLHARAHICDWQGRTEGWSKVIRALRDDARVSTPFALLASPASAADHRKCSMIYAANRIPPAATQSWRGERASHERIRVAYLSDDFREHPTSHLAAGLFEHHDRTRFETIGISYGVDDGSAMRARVSRAFDRFVDVRHKSDPAIARLIRELEVDIAIDLMGYTAGMRANLLVQRPAPLQVSYLGYPGTMGAEFIDYILADHVVIPQEHRKFYTEQIAYLPGCYQTTDAGRPVADATPSRGAAGLPAHGFVFCCFNNSFKITPEIFDVWMRLLRAVEGSVLWLLEGSVSCVRNLRREADARGVAPDRVVFAPRIASAEHLARQRLADLFLDTIYYGAHTTASDALFVGLPVVTHLGATFPSRVAASLLHAVGLPELIAGSLADYEAMAMDLARNHEQLAALRCKLMRQRLSFPLFDTGSFTRHIETAYQTMWERHQQGEPPQTFTVGAATLSNSPCADDRRSV